LSLLATSAADSGVYGKYLSDLSSSNLTSNIALQMITEKKVRQIYYNRALLLLQIFANKVETLVDGLKSIDVTDTAASMANKMISEMPSFIKTRKCNHNFCSVPVLKVTSTQLPLNVYDCRINIENDLQEYIKDSEKNCSFCGNKRSITVEPTTHIIIELSSIPSGKYY